MKSNSLIRNILLAVVSSALVLSFVVWMWWPRSANRLRPELLHPPKGDYAADIEELAKHYDWVESRRNLEQIGRIVQAHRASKGYKPVAERTSEEDIGITGKELGDLVRAQSATTRFVTSRKWPAEDVSSEKVSTQYKIILGGIGGVLDENELARVWSERGEELPIIMDDAMYEPFMLSRTSKPFRVLVLRLGGKVDEILVQYGDGMRSPERKEKYLKL